MPEERDEPYIDLDQVDRRARCYRLICNGYTIKEIVVATGYAESEVRQFKRELPKWWRLESMRAAEGKRSPAIIKAGRRLRNRSVREDFS